MWKSIRIWLDLIIPFIGAAGTLFLGYTAYRQNNRILKVEENSFISKHSCTGFVQEVKVNDLKKLGDRKIIISSLKKQIMISDNLIEDKYMGYYYLDLDLKMDMQGALPAYYRVMKLKIFINRHMVNDHLESAGTSYHFSSLREKYSKAAVYKEGIALSICLLLDDDQVGDIKDHLEHLKSTIEMDIELALVTNEMVESKLLCRSKLIRPDSYFNIFNTKKIPECSPSFYWKGSNILEKDKVEIITEDDTKY